MFRRRIEDWLIRRLPSRRAAAGATFAVAREGISIVSAGTTRLVRWSDIDRVVATKAEQLIGNTFVLVFALRDGSTMSITEHDPAWRATTEILPTVLPGAQSVAAWSVALLAEPDVKVEVYRR